MEAKNQVDGNYQFIVKMHEDCAVGTYTFQISVNGTSAGMVQQAYVWPDGGYDEIQKFVFDQNMQPGGSIAAIAGIKVQDAAPLPSVVIALYQNGNLVKAQMGALQQEEGGIAEIRAQITNLPQNLENYEVKAFLFTNLTELKPMIKMIRAK